MHLSIPVTPDPDTARRWAEDELSQSLYRHGESLADRLMRWILDFVEKLLNAGSGGSIPPVGYLLGAILVIVLLVIAARIAIPAAQQRRRGKNAVLLGDDARTAQQMRDSAQEAEHRGEYTLASLEYFRALVRGAEERVIIDERAGRTAREAATDIATAIGTHVTELRSAATTFDALCYGHREGTKADSSSLKALESAMRGTRAIQLATP